MKQYNLYRAMMGHDKLVTVNVTLHQSTLNYVDLVAFNRFIDNVRKALNGDVECRDNLLGEDLQDMLDFGHNVWRALQYRTLP